MSSSLIVSSHPTGRPHKFTPDRIKRLLDAISAGNFLEPSCQFAGIDYQTLRAWIKRGELEGEGSEFYDFSENVKLAQAKAEIGLAATIKKASLDNWQAAGWMLTRRFAERWSDSSRVKIEVETQLEKTLDTLEKQLPPELYSQVLAAIAGTKTDDFADEATAIAAIAGTKTDDFADELNASES
ncbi:MAG: hypothetical protein ACRC4X_05290 [Cetobacterium sp.]